MIPDILKGRVDNINRERVENLLIVFNKEVTEENKVIFLGALNAFEEHTPLIFKPSDIDWDSIPNVIEKIKQFPGYSDVLLERIKAMVRAYGMIENFDHFKRAGVGFLTHTEGIILARIVGFSLNQFRDDFCGKLDLGSSDETCSDDTDSDDPDSEIDGSHTDSTNENSQDTPPKKKKKIE